MQKIRVEVVVSSVVMVPLFPQRSNSHERSFNTYGLSSGM